MPKLVVDVNVAERQHTHGNRPHLEMPYGDELTVVSEHFHDVAVGHIVVHPLQRAGEHPRMEAAQTVFLTFLQVNCLVFHKYYYL